MTPEQQAVLDKVRSRIKDSAQLEAQLQNLDAEDDEAILAKKRQAALERVRAIPAISEAQTKPEDSFFDNVLDVAGEFALGANRSVADVADLVTSPLRGAANLGAWVAGAEGRMPSFRQLLEATPGGTEGFMEEGTAKDVVSALGYTVPVGASFMPVQRAAGATSSVVQDILGLGTSSLSNSQKMGEITARAIQDMDGLRLGKKVLETDDDIFQAAYRLGKKQVIERNRPLMNHAEALEMERLKQIEKSGVSDITPPTASTKVSLREVQDQMYAIYGVDPKDTLRAIGKNKGLRYDDDLLSLAEADKFFKGGLEVRDVNWYDKTFLPVADVLKRYIDPRVGGMFERATESYTRKVSTVVEELGKPIENVIRLLDDNTQLKRLFLDIGKDPSKIKDIQRIIATEAGEESLVAFNKFLKVTGQKNGEALRKLFVKDGGFDDIIYIHTQKKPDTGVRKPKPNSRRGRRSIPGEKPNALRVRTRKAASEMDDAEVSMYENPLATHLQYIAEQEYLLELADKFGMRPSLSKNANITDFFREIEHRLKRDGLSDFHAKQAADVMFDAYEGARTAPNAAMRAFMNLSYAGALAQFKTSLLNLHDAAVSMWNQGLRPTLKAMVQSNKGQFGKSLEKMGIGDNQSVGEFVQNFDKYQADPTIMDKAARVTKKISNGAMFISAFKALDRVGKGVVLRATLNRARASARDGTLVRDFGHLMREDELIKLRRHLANNTSAKDVPADVAALMEELAFTGLGEQQLISVAGRPLNYLNHPNLRPAYALTGFAIKQQALLRRKVLDEIVRGNYAEAGKQAAGYAAYAGFGYGIINEGRQAISGKEEFDAGDIYLGAIDQVVAAATLNRLGDDYGRGKFLQDPVDYLMTSFLPPTGLTGAAAQDVVTAIEAMVMGGEFDSKLAERFPMLGDFYKYYWKEE